MKSLRERSALIAAGALLAITVTGHPGSATIAADASAAPSAAPLLSGTPEPTEEPTTPPSDAIVAAAAVGPEWSAFAKIAEGASDFITTFTTHESANGTSFAKTIKVSSRKPHFARCEITAGDGIGGVAVWRGGDKVQAHEGGEHKDIIVVLNRHNKRVTDLLGDGCGDTTPDEIVGYSTAHGKLTEVAGPTVGGEATDDVTWIVNPGDQVRATKVDFFISKVTHLMVETKAYIGDQLVADASVAIQVNPGLKFSTFDIGG